MYAAALAVLWGPQTPVIDDSVTRSKLSPMNNSTSYLFAVEVADRKVLSLFLYLPLPLFLRTIHSQITSAREVKKGVSE